MGSFMEILREKRGLRNLPKMFEERPPLVRSSSAFPSAARDLHFTLW